MEVFTSEQPQPEPTQQTQNLSAEAIQSLIAKGIQEGLASMKSPEPKNEDDVVDRVRKANELVKSERDKEANYELLLESASNESQEILADFEHSSFIDTLKEIAKTTPKVVDRRDMVKRACVEEMIAELRTTGKKIETSLLGKMEKFTELTPSQKQKYIEENSFFDTVKGVYSSIMNNSVKSPEELKSTAFDVNTPTGKFFTKITKGIKVSFR